MDTTIQIHIDGCGFMAGGNSVQTEKLEFFIDAKTHTQRIQVALKAPLKGFVGSMQVRLTNRNCLKNYDATIQVVEEVESVGWKPNPLILKPASSTDSWRLVDFIKFCAGDLR